MVPHNSVCNFYDAGLTSARPRSWRKPRRQSPAHNNKRGSGTRQGCRCFFANLPSHASEDALQGFNLIVPKVLRLLHIVGLGEVGHREHRPVGQLRLRDSQLEV